MTATQLIDNLSKTSLSGLKISDLTTPTVGAENIATLLVLLNMAKDKIAEDTMLWLGGETIVMATGTNEYTLTSMPISIIDVFDTNNNLRPRNSSDYYGYYQTSPNTVSFNNITNGLNVKVNYYTTPADYLIGDTIIVPPTLLSAMQFYIAHKAFEIYKADKDILMSTEYYKKYRNVIDDFKATTDSTSVDSVVSMNNKIFLRGLK